MAVEKLIESILKEAEKEAQDIKRRAQQESQQILEEAKLDIQKKIDLLFKEEQRKINQEVERILSEARIEAKKVILEAKREILDDIFNTFLQYLDPAKLPKRQKVFFDRTVEEPLNKEDFLKEIRETFEPDLIKILKLDEE